MVIYNTKIMLVIFIKISALHIPMSSTHSHGLPGISCDIVLSFAHVT